ncbi:AMP-binding protein [Mycobacterium heckeshornense]|uniref:ATP-dependent acyl-CoA ligase n=1 Tax=Mycobacterium heckeshornense TaxID=110505 RepID=A0A2I3ELD6_9MYCO|nr:AMP-binding protein [Mycobacterium heckeshornense]KMV20797.1 acyl-CoA synthetase [Mycobacterium heckeshornense]MCV7033297.1 AMP-binding protein [Mycobacterium heckeshornense]BCO36265.1 ATP-dependent acyl-CoA ligase [Mycobacterium heckeshornense]
MARDDGQPGRTLGGWLREEAALDPGRPFVQCDSDWVTLGELDEQSDRVAAGLQAAGVDKGDRVAINLCNSLEYIVLIYAVAKAGAIQVPLNTYLRGDFLRHQLVQTSPKIYIGDNAAMDLLTPILPTLTERPRLVLVGEPAQDLTLQPDLRYTQLQDSSLDVAEPDIHPTDVCAIIYTSGTTGPSKGCTITHGYYCNLINVFVDAGWYEKGDIVFGANPLFHFSGQTWLVAAALAVRGSAIVEPAFHASTYMARIRETGATVALGMGAMGMAIMAQPPHEDDRNHKLRHITFMPSTAEFIEQFEKRFGIAPFAEVFGQSECWPVLLGDPRDKRRPGSMGKPTKGLQVKIVDDNDVEVPVGESGEIVVRPDEPFRLFSGYWNDDAATVQAFRNLWHHTGDRGRVDEDGYFWFVDRKKDSLRRRGENVSSIELEQAIMAHPSIAQAAVHSVPSELSEDDIKLCLVLVPGCEIEPAELFEFLRKSMPYYAIPRYVEVMDSLPTNVNGRVQKYKLRERGITDTTIDFEKLGHVVARGDRRKA